jgi:hypothetical protein
MTSVHENAKIQESIPPCSVFLYVFSTDEGALKKLSVNRIPFLINEPRIVLGLLFRKLLPNLREQKIHAYPHNNMLYVFFEEKHEDTLSRLEKIVGDFANKLRNAVSCNPKDVEVEELFPGSNVSHFLIARSLLYSYLKNILRGRDVYIPLSSKRAREGLRVFVSRENIGEDDTHSYKICKGLRFLFEVTPKYRGHLWVDAITEAFEEDLSGSLRRLSHYEMKKLSSELNMELYSEYLRRARMDPKTRAKWIENSLTRLNVKDLIVVKYYIYNVMRKTFDEICVPFRKLHDKPQLG